MNDDHRVAEIRAIVQHLARALSTARLYSQEHPRMGAALAAILDPLQELLRKTPELTLVVVEEDLLYRGKPLDPSPHTRSVAKLLSSHGVGHVAFFAGVAASDFRQFLRWVGGEEKIAAFKKLRAKIRVGGVDVPASAEEGGEAPVTSVQELSEARLAELGSCYRAIGDEAPTDPRPLISLVAGFITAFRREANPLLALAPLRMVDEYTFTHSVDVGILNIAQGMSLGIEGQTLHDLGVAGMLHDAGKIFVDREIIGKPGQLNEAELAVMRTHPSRGAQYLMNQPGVSPLAVISAYEHHMRFDLQGYPSPGKGWTLNLASQVTMISDTFDALRTRRVYKAPWDFPKVCGHMLTLAGAQLNGDLIVNFLNLLAELGEDLPPLPEDGTVPVRQCYCE